MPLPGLSQVWAQLRPVDQAATIAHERHQDDACQGQGQQHRLRRRRQARLAPPLPVRIFSRREASGAQDKQLAARPRRTKAMRQAVTDAHSSDTTATANGSAGDGCGLNGDGLSARRAHAPRQHGRAGPAFTPEAGMRAPLEGT